MASLSCPLCRGEDTAFFLRAEDRDYHRCGACGLRFMDPYFHLPRDAEYALYLQHENDVQDQGYRAFLSRLTQPLLARLPQPSQGLDFGCGPGPALVAMMEDAGHEMAVYDPFFAPDTSVLTGTYDFVTCTETAEHFHDPAKEFATLMAIVRPGGWLGMLTCFQTDDARFADWHYRKDPTHTVFYREETFHWIAVKAGWRVTIPRKDVALLQNTPPR